ncbi:hypothetical protein HQQ94_05685 [Shewanella sp. VB17]|uniref:hypothetical protein n=1 Tax=Shewanella sp. VB17 TaxID=2739432 RepID=UPI0015668EEF|nr:hypothetical protein [Shewanella sp. VB17]NRD72747.1 hypothetical protein [Shewanella sp. VB17]
MKMLIKKISIAILSSIMVVCAAFSTLANTQVQAHSDKMLNQSYDYHGQQVLLDLDVGSAEVFATDEQDIRIEVRVSHSQSSWFSLWTTADLDDIDLEVKQTSNYIKLKLSDQDDVRQQWKIYLPRQAAIDLNVGVGKIEVNNMESDVNIDLGVGHAQVNYGILYGSVALESGVGEVNMAHLGRLVTVEQNFVRQAYYHKEGAGFGQLSVNVGVGQIDVEHF